MVKCCLFNSAYFESFFKRLSLSGGGGGEAQPLEACVCPFVGRLSLISLIFFRIILKFSKNFKLQ